MFTNIDEIKRVIAIECDRQHVGEAHRGFLFDAYSRAYAHYQLGEVLPTAEAVLELAGILEPDNYGRLRTTPVTFQNGGGSTAPSQVAHAYGVLFEGLPAMAEEPYVHQWMREFLYVHPFTDGNGRTAWLLLNWILGRWENPMELPEYF